MEATLEHSLTIKSPVECRQIVLEEVTYSIGRIPSNTIVINSPEISRQHAILLCIAVPNSEHRVFRLVDGNLKGLQSTNGIFVNGVKRSSHILRHGDEIDFGGPTKAIYTCTTKAEAADLQNPDLEQNQLNPFGTVMVEKAITASSVDAEMARLVSFLELSPHPIIELDLRGNITYLNPASTYNFPNLKQLGIKHPILTGLIHLVKTANKTSLVREIDLGTIFYQQAIYFLPESQRIRLNMLDITSQKKSEAELLNRDKLLQAIAQATKTLLVELNFQTAVQSAIQTLGQAAKVDYIFVSQHIFKPQEHPSLKTQFEWSTDDSLHLTDQLLRPDYFFNQQDIDTWYTPLMKGQAIKQHKIKRARKNPKDIPPNSLQSILLVPLFLKGQYWGFIGIADCQKERQWSTHEESSVFTLAASISAALNRKQVAEKMRHRALYDELTNLPNRTLFNESLSFHLRNAHRHPQSLAVMFLDLDRFKAINDTLGHTIGDQLLKGAAIRISQALRKGDVAARWGGDEFTILLPRIRHTQEATDVAEKILKLLDTVFEIEEHELYVTGSIGIACLDSNSYDNETLIKHADIALYRAKEQGRNAYEIYNHSLDSKSPEVLTLEKDLRMALARNEFMVYYQPRINLSNGQIAGVEALIRWKHPKMGLVSPQVFIPIAEENGLIIPIGEWVLRQACLQNKRWQEAGFSPITMAVNLSPRQFRQPNLLERVASILKETGLESQYLELEITESEAIQNIEFTTQVLESIHRMGVKVSVDDFGTGHSSLNRLQCLPFDNLKIDQSFIRDLMPDNKVSHIVSTIVSLGQKLGLHIVAEGVEENEQLDFLKSIHCDTVQGYIFYKPISSLEMQAVLQLEAETKDNNPQPSLV